MFSGKIWRPFAAIVALGTLNASGADAVPIMKIERTYGEELTIGAVFFPILRALESAKGDDAAQYAAAQAAGYLSAADVSRMKGSPDAIQPSFFRDQCGVLTDGKRVWSQPKPADSATAHAQPEEIPQTASEPSSVKTDPYTVKTDPYTMFSTAEAESALGKPQTPAERIKCMIVYQSVVDRAVNLLGRSETSRIVRYDVGRNMTYALEGLQARAQKAFWLALGHATTMRDARFWQKRFAEGDQVCTVPTPTGLKAGKSEFICGAFMMDQNAGVFVEGGRVFSEDSVHGLYIKFAETIKPASAKQ